VPVDARKGELTLTAAEEVAICEFLRREDDERLGRYRYRSHPNYVVYPTKSPDLVIVLDETNAGTEHVYRQGAAPYLSAKQSTHPSSDPGPYGAAGAYFAERPVKPWLKAKPGEIWLLSLEGEAGRFHGAVVEKSGRMFRLSDRHMMLDDSKIVNGMRLECDKG